MEPTKDDEAGPSGEGWTRADKVEADAARLQALFHHYFRRYKLLIYLLVAIGWAVVAYWWVFGGAEIFRR